MCIRDRPGWPPVCSCVWRDARAHADAPIETIVCTELNSAASVSMATPSRAWKSVALQDLHCSE
eukprot:7835711-Prorocentrum_lima.AAC.1